LRALCLCQLIKSWKSGEMLRWECNCNCVFPWNRFKLCTVHGSLLCTWKLQTSTSAEIITFKKLDERRRSIFTKSSKNRMQNSKEKRPQCIYLSALPVVKNLLYCFRSKSAGIVQLKTGSNAGQIQGNFPTSSQHCKKG
jgi:hypothetical protein